ncbi:PIG-L deacetylase family protein [Verrucosispora sioxanthis]|uniref:GlcNAc-PI de-N-acetylase n=1 Tax=Verrucosispora sioxanthis TaxID=2499994 RepID=A0A6M1L4K4_9ACTN|nr:PIG-L family deacetylase [Verrucosispora sioxanthis]NEE65017.1 GlcNAc-PI de-N-acetylase [Verrucosispora sioxanthis]NGM14127.1 GlcNAc-PI de-N-acetylase [Verrucosispora sioxanthis]
MLSSHTVIVLHAHPDDEAIFTGLTMRRLADAGARVILVMATDGAAGVPHVPLSRGESLRSRRLAELERACDLLGVARLEVLGYADSGAHGGPYRAGTLGAASATRVARQVARIASREGATTLVHYDPGGIYRHVDHVQVHRVGALVTRSLQLAGYQATVDASALRAGPRHVLQRAAGDLTDMGVPASRISLAVDAEGADLLAKMAAMATHASQVGAADLDPSCFAAAYGREWFVREGRLGALDALLAASAGPAEATHRNLQLDGTAI